MIKPIAITAGEPAGIGPDVIVKILAEGVDFPYRIIGDTNVLQQRAKQLQLPFDHTAVHHIPCAKTVKPGQLDPANAAHVLALLEHTGQGCLAGDYSAVVTAPVAKSVINDAGIPFRGHTEFFAQLSQRDTVVMMLAHQHCRVALVTTHLPLSQVPNAITPTRLRDVITILHHDLIHHFAITNPRILVCGLNPHAGEHGHLGGEEVDIINPVLESFQQQGMNVSLAMPADTCLTPYYIDRCDAILAMYHDQGLPVLKHRGFHEAVNITLGLPFIRTSVDHGTALNLAGSGKASAGSLRAALNSAVELVNHSQGSA